MWFDRSRLVRIGRPQAATAERRPGGPRPTVLYAPTWEGAQPSMAYSSVPSHGAALVRSLMAAGLRVVYRPHPRTGANRRDVAAADAALRRLFTADEARSTGSGVETDVPLEAAFADADVLVTDISSVAVEWLPTGRPLVVTVPADPAAVVSSSPLLDAVPRVTADQAGTTGDLVRRCLDDDAGPAARTALIEHYLGSAGPADALARFLDACSDLVAARDLVQAAPTQGSR
jgi:hypothetical protein